MLKKDVWDQGRRLRRLSSALAQVCGDTNLGEATRDSVAMAGNAEPEAAAAARAGLPHPASVERREADARGKHREHHHYMSKTARCR